MRPTNTTALIHRLAVAAALAAPLVISACTSPTTAEAPAATVRFTQPPTTLPSASEFEPPVMTEIPADIDPTADSTDPMAVAEAFITTLTNRTASDSDETWRRRWTKWTTASLASELATSRGPAAYRDEIAKRGGLAVGTVIGSAVYNCDVDRCAVDVVADQIIILDGRPLEEANFVTWGLELQREPAGWRVDGIVVGAGA